jgi:hypothetical protein
VSGQPHSSGTFLPGNGIKVYLLIGAWVGKWGRDKTFVLSGNGNRNQSLYLNHPASVSVVSFLLLFNFSVF